MAYQDENYDSMLQDAFRDANPDGSIPPDNVDYEGIRDRTLYENGIINVPPGPSLKD